MQDMLRAVRARTLVVSFNNEGYITREDMDITREDMEAQLGSLWNGSAVVTTLENDYKRYVGAQIGIFNPQGEKVGKVSHLRNKEYLYVVTQPGAENAFAQPQSRRESQMHLGV